MNLSFDLHDGLIISSLFKICIGTHNFDKKIWDKLCSVDLVYIKDLFEFELDMYYVNYIFKDDDVDGMLKLCKKYPELKNSISTIVSKLYTTKAIAVLEEIGFSFSENMKHDFEQREHTANILLTGLKYKYYNTIVIEAYEYLKLYRTDNLSILLTTIYEYFNTIIDENQFCDTLPKLSGAKGYWEPFNKIIVEILINIKNSITKNNQTKVDLIIKQYKKERKI